MCMTLSVVQFAPWFCFLPCFLISFGVGFPLFHACWLLTSAALEYAEPYYWVISQLFSGSILSFVLICVTLW
jgi:hypothetical protein